MLHPGVAGAEDHEEVGAASLGELPIGPGVRGAAAVEVDVGGDHPAYLGRGALAAPHGCGALAAPLGLRRSPTVDRSRSVGRREEPVEHRAELAGLSRIGSAGVGGRTRGRSEKSSVDHGAPVREARAVQKSLLIEGLGDLRDLPPLDELTVTAHHRSLDVGDGMASVEEGHDLEQRAVQQDDRIGVTGGVAERDAGPSFVFHRKGFHSSQPGDRFAHGRAFAHRRKFRAEAT